MLLLSGIAPLAHSLWILQSHASSRSASAMGHELFESPPVGIRRSLDRAVSVTGKAVEHPRGAGVSQHFFVAPLHAVNDDAFKDEAGPVAVIGVGARMRADCTLSRPDSSVQPTVNRDPRVSAREAGGPNPACHDDILLMSGHQRPSGDAGISELGREEVFMQQ